MNLKLGKMTGHEIAEWLGISYNSTYRNNPTEQIKKLGGYCEYQQVRGGVIISKIYTGIYYGDLSKKLVKAYVKNVQERKNGLSSVAGVTRDLQHKNEEYADMKYATLYYQLGKAGELTYGKTNLTPCTEFEGAYGSRYSVWAIKLDDFNHYRWFTAKEEKMFDEIISCYYGSDPKKVKQLAILDDAFRKNEITKEEYFQKKDEMDLDFFAQCILRFRDKTGLIVARVQYHVDNSGECAFEVEPKED